MDGTWPDDIRQLDLHISDLELYTIVIAVKLWASQLTGLCVLIACDNEAATISINSGKSKDPFMQKCLRELWFIAAVHDFEIPSVHIPGTKNLVADWLSRWFDLVCRERFKSYTMLSRSH